jgi:hypothetical protein
VRPLASCIHLLENSLPAKTFLTVTNKDYIREMFWLESVPKENEKKRLISTRTMTKGKSSLHTMLQYCNRFQLHIPQKLYVH